MRLIDRPVVRVRSSLIEDLACRSKACAPPPVGVGGSGDAKSAGGARSSDSATQSPSGGSGGTIGLDPGGKIPADAGAIMKMAQSGINEGNDQRMQSELYAARGYDEKGKVLSREEFNDAAENGDFEEGWRGLDGPRWGPVDRIQRPAQYAAAERQVSRDIIDGDTHYPGRGILGNGTYIALDPSTHLARQTASGYGANLVRIGLPESITKNDAADFDEVQRYVSDIIYDDVRAPLKQARDDYEDHNQTRHDAAFKTADNLVKAGEAAGMGRDDVLLLLGDAGRVAIVLGVHGYTDRSSSGPAYVVGLNRGVMTFDSTVYDNSGITPRHKPADGVG